VLLGKACLYPKILDRFIQISAFWVKKQTNILGYRHKGVGRKFSRANEKDQKLAKITEK